MVKMKYMVEGHTYFSVNGKEKVKVVTGEIVEVDEKMVGRMNLAGFVACDKKAEKKAVEVEVEDDGKDEIEVEVKAEKKAKK